MVEISEYESIDPEVPGPRTFALISRVLQAEDGVQDTLDAICRLAVELVPGADHAGLTYVRADQFSSPAASSDIPRIVDAAQYRTNEGPCLSAIREAEIVESPDLEADPRWPAFTRQTMERSPVRGMLAYRLFFQDDTVGALNFYAERRNAFDERSRTTGGVFAVHAGVAWEAARKQEQNANLSAALVTSRRIGAAIGIVMVTRRLTEDAAFELLRSISQRRHRKLRDVADDVIFTGALDESLH